jgi:hypothetical protein
MDAGSASWGAALCGWADVNKVSNNATEVKVAQASVA